MAENEVYRKLIGPGSAYAFAKEGGYTGTKKEYETLMASYGTVAEQAAQSARRAEEAAASITTDDTLSITGKAADAKKTGDEISAIKNDSSNIHEYVYNALTKQLAYNASTYFYFPMFPEKTYVFKNTGASGQVAFFTRYTQDGQDVETISSSANHGVSIEFTPQYRTDVLRVFCNAENGSFSVYQKDTYIEDLKAAEDDIAANTAQIAELEASTGITYIADGFAKIISIKATKEQYINTGINYDAHTGFEIEFTMFSPFGQAATMGNVLGSRVASGNQDLELNTFSSSATGLFRYGTSSAQRAANLIREKRIRATWKNGVYTVFDVEANTQIFSGSAVNVNTSDNGYPIYLFALNNAGTATGLAEMSLYNAKLYNDDEIVANFIPTYNESTGKTGLYDTVRATFYGDANGGDFDADYGLALQIRQNTEDIENLKQGIVEDGTLYPAEIQTSIEAYQTVLASSGKPMLTFPVFTDLHHDEKYANDPTNDMMANIRKIYDYIHCDGVLNLGDAIDGQNQTKYEAETALGYVVNKMYAITDRSHNVEGNHDSNVQSTWQQYGEIEGARLTLPELYDALNKGSENEIHDFNTRLTNYYIDFEEYGIRAIFLGINYVTFTEDTKTWLENVALDTTLPVIVFAHCPTRPEWGFENDVQNGIAYVEAPLKAFVSNGGTVIAYIHGHTHGDNIVTDTDISWYEVSIGCAKYETLSGSHTAGITYQPRNANNVTKILFDIVCVDTTSRSVHFIRFGAGSDRSINY